VKFDRNAVVLRAADLLLTQAVSVLAKECIDFLDCRDVCDTTEQPEEKLFRNFKDGIRFEGIDVDVP
jgi:hypothetical protein